MKFKRFILCTLIVPALIGCKNKNKPVVKDPLVIPTVDVESLNINLPKMPKYNEGSIRTDGTYDYLDIYEISDFHGAVYFEEDETKANIGLSKLATFMNNKRSTNEGGTLLLSCGDMFQGSADSNLTRGYLVNYAMHYMGFDAMTIGNHEFDWTDEWLKKNSSLKYNLEDQIPYLGANIIDRTTQEMPTFLQKSTVVTRGNYKIGIIGTIGPDLEDSILKSCVENYFFNDEVDIVKNEAKRLKDDGCDVVVWCSHENLEKMKKIENVDAMFGGHSHYNGVGSLDIPGAATENYGRGIAHIELKIEKSNKTNVSGTSEVYSIVPGSNTGTKENGVIPTGVLNISNDDGIDSIISQYTPAINNIKNIRLGKSDSEFRIDNELKNICTESMFLAAKDFVKTNNYEIPEDKIIAAFHNVRGGIRQDLAKGEIHYGDIFKPFPFDNEIVLVKVTGLEIVQQSAAYSYFAACKTFSSKKDLNLGDSYYFVLSDYLCLTDLRMNEAKLIRTGIIVRESIAKRIYDLDEIKSSDYLNGIKKFNSMPIVL